MTRNPVPGPVGRPSDAFRSIQDELAHMLDFSRRATVQPAAERNDFFSQRAAMPALDVAETETSFEISAEVPGVPEEDLDVAVHGDVLVIKGEKTSDTEDKQKDYHLIERRYGSFRRQIPLGFVPEKGAVSATFENGVLKLSVEKPKTVQGGVQKVRIGRS